MNSNFHLETRKENQELHIRLHGVFDGASAFELIEVIQAGGDRLMFIDTSQLTQAYPFGKSILDAYLPKTALRPRLHFSGAWAGEVLPEGCSLLKEKKHHCQGNCQNCTCRSTMARSQGKETVPLKIRIKKEGE